MRSCAFRCLDCSVDKTRSHAFDDCRVLVHGAARIQRPLRRHPPPTLCCLRSRPFDVAVSKEIIQLITQPCLLSPIHDSRPGQFSNCCFPIDPARAAKVLPSLLSITVTTPKVLCCIVARQATILGVQGSVSLCFQQKRPLPDTWLPLASSDCLLHRIVLLVLLFCLRADIRKSLQDRPQAHRRKTNIALTDRKSVV